MVHFLHPKIMKTTLILPLLTITEMAHLKIMEMAHLKIKISPSHPVKILLVMILIKIFLKIIQVRMAQMTKSKQYYFNQFILIVKLN
ncbi:unnamed protein product [Blepharisma stoltei]|uniref:Uncharacterized protein n=1 Tax=Blepharisma stoltei TaxID=1481888 RepID=A0AAU9JRN6_9CILI|nr:unnamed protein product [Blepharisma stoltei]